MNQPPTALAPEFQPLTPERWSDLVALFDHHGNPGNCWCMTWRLTSTQYKQWIRRAYAKSQGARIIEGYPVEPDQSYRFMGAPPIFEQAGFHKAALAWNGRKIVRYAVEYI